MSKLNDELMEKMHEAAKTAMGVLEELAEEERNREEREEKAARQEAVSGMATFVREQFDAFLEKGFTVEQSFELTKMLLCREVQ